MKDEVCGACITYGKDDKCMQSCEETPKGSYQLEDLDVDGRILLKWK
jgi:hypothetical protein